MQIATIETEGLDAGVHIVGGKAYRPDARGNLVPEELIKAEQLLEDETVRKIHRYATQLSEQIARFRGHTFEDINGFVSLLDQEYGVSKGGRKGNMTFTTFDGLKKVQVQVADIIDFGAQLQTAKALIDECLTEWAADSRPEIRAIVTRAFNTDKEGQVNRAEIFMLLRLDIADPRWQRAMDALRDAIRVVGSREYVRFYERDRPDGEWRAVTIDLAKA